MSLMRAGVVFAVVVALTFDALPATASPGANLFAAYQAAPPSSAGAGTTLQLPESDRKDLYYAIRAVFCSPYQ